MFTGIVEAVGTVREVNRRSRTCGFTLEAPGVMAGLVTGASVSVDGACLTAVEILEEGFTVEVIGTTLSRTVAGGYAPGSRVNLERALRLGGRLDGHLVQGHVDGVGELLEVRQEGEFHLMDFQIPREVAVGTILHGSIALNGVSLTVNRLEGVHCQVGVIPHTWENTNLGLLRPGSRVNVEGDLIGKYVGKWLAVGGGVHPPVAE